VGEYEEKVAVTLFNALRSIVQLLLFTLEHFVQELKYESFVELLLGVAMRVTEVPLTNCEVHVPEIQEIPDGLLLMFPVPFPEKETDNGCMATTFE
jgi:hypothetical protein